MGVHQPREQVLVLVRWSERLFQDREEFAAIADWRAQLTAPDSDVPYVVLEGRQTLGKLLV